MCGTGFLLKAPGGQNMAIFEAPDGQDCSATWSGVTLTLSDTAASTMGDGFNTAFPGAGGGATITAAQTFKPTSYRQGLSSLIYPSPGPVTPSNRPAPQGSATTTLASVFGGATAAGTWSLYLIDSDGDSVSISSFSLKLVMAVASPTTTAISSSRNPTWTTAANNTTTLTATVTSSGSPVTSGTVNFTDGATTLCSAATVNGGGVATCSASFSTEGVHTPTATYSGTGSYGTSNASLNQWVKNHSTLSSGNYCNSGAINLPNGTGWSPHPSVINVGTDTTDITNSVSTLTVTLNGFSSASAPLGVQAMLVSPDGRGYQFLYHGGGGAGAFGPANVTFSDSAASRVPQASFGSGTYQPGVYQSGAAYSADVSPLPSPPATFKNAAPLSSDTFTTAFQGAPAHGDWLLYMESSGQTAGVSSGWCLNITAATGTPSVTTLASSANPATKGASVTLTATVKNGNTNAALTTGTVTFTENGAAPAGTVSGNNVVNVVNGIAAFTTSSLAEGDHPITATYNDSSHTFSLSFGQLVQRVDSATTAADGPGTSVQYCNPGAILLPASNTPPNNIGPGTPNPSNIFVTKLPGVLQGRTEVLLNGFHGTESVNVAALLVGPAATSATSFDFFSATCGTAPFGPFNFTFSDVLGSNPVGCTTNLSNGAPTSGGPWKPTDLSQAVFGAADTFTASTSGFYTLPAAPYQHAATTGSSTFSSVFGSTSGAGTWSLYFNQNSHPSAQGGADNGWCVNVYVTPPVLTMTESHSPDPFVRGQTGNIVLHVSNNGPGPTGYPLLTVTDTLNAAFTYNSYSGTGWTCGNSGQTVTCTNPNVVAAAASYPDLTITVNVLTTVGTTPVANSATVSGSKITPVTSATDNIPVIGTDLTIAKSHTGNFTPGSTGTYTIKVHNNGPAATNSGETITMSDSLPSGFTQQTLSGTGWTCNTPLTCTSTTTINSGADSNPITMVVNVAQSAPNATNSASVSAADDITAGNNTANDATIVLSHAYNATSTAADGSYKAGASIPIVLAWNNPVTVTGTPKLALNSGGTASYSSGSGTNTLTFGYTVQAGENASHLDYASASALSLNGGAIVDTANPSLNALLTLPVPGAAGSLGANKNIVIDTAPPTVSNISSSTANGTYSSGKTVSIQITWSEAVTVGGTPQLALNSGGTAVYTSGSGTATLTFTYTVGANDNAAALDAASVSALTLNGGTIQDAATNNAFLTLPLPGAAGSLSANKTIVIATATTTTAANATANASTSVQAVALTATVTSTGGAVNAGTVTFIVKDSGNNQIGVPTVSAPVTNNNASVSFSLPANTPPGSYQILATYAGSTTFQSSSDSSHTLTVAGATATTAANATATFSSSNQNVTLSATVTTPGSTVNSGIVIFTVFDGSNSQVGLPASSGTVSGGAASATYILPANTAAGTYSIHTSYAANGNFLASSDNIHTLTVNPAATTTTGANATATFSAASQTVPLSATVTSAAGTVGAGTVTFTLLNSSSAPVGSPVTSGAVSGGSAGASYTLPAGTPAGTYTIQAVYSGTANFLTSTDSTHTLTINASSTTTASNATVTYSPSDQAVNLGATVTSAAGTVNAGSVTFTVFNGANAQVGAAPSATVSGGAASASYTFPGGTAAGTYTIRAAYGGAGNFLASTDTAHTLTVNPASTTTTAANATAPFSATDQTVALSAAVTSSAGTVNTGTVTFTVKSGATVIGSPVTSGTVSSGAASASFTLPGGTAVGTYTIQAAYNGSGNFGASTDTTHTLTINSNTVQVTVGTSPSGPSFTVDGTPYTSPQTLTWNIGSSHTIATTSPQTAAPAQYTFGSWSDGGALSHNVTASAGTTSYTATFSVKYLTSTAIQSSLNASTFGQAVTFTAMVSSAGPGTPTGTVQFYDGGSPLGSPVSLNGSAQAALTTSALAAGSHSITASYSGDGAFVGSNGSMTGNPQVVSQASTTTSLIPSTTSSVYGQSVTFTATVSAGIGTPTGTVTFLDGGASIGTGTLSGGQATFTTSTLPVGVRSITASYGGDTSFLTSASAAVGVTVSLGTANVALLSSQSPSAFGQSVTFTATVTGANGGTPTSTVTFKDGVYTIGQGTLSSGVATYSTSTLSAGTHSITAVYGGDAHFGSATSAALSQVVQKLTPAVSLGSSPNPSVTGQLVTFTATVSGSADTPAGTVTFTSGSTTLTTATVSGGTATATFALTATGAAQSVTAQYGGDTEYVAANSAPASQTVNAANTSVALTASSNPALLGNAVTFTATVSAVAPGQGTPAGSVAFYDGATLLNTVALSGGVATLATSSLSAGTHNISAQYGSTNAFNGSTSSTVSESIGSPGTATVLASSANPSVLGNSVTLTATVTSGGTTPQGSVTFYNGASQIGTANLSAGVGSISLASLPAGTSTLTATYSSTNGLNPSTSGSLSQVVLVPVTVQALPATAQITVDGTNYTGPQTFDWVAGSLHSLSAPSPQALSATSRLIWSSWSNGAGAAAQTVTAPSAPTTYTATFATQYLVSVASNPALGGSISGGGYYTAGTTANLTATANTGYSFSSFSGDASSSTNPIGFTVNAPMSVVANFIAGKPILSVSIAQRTDGSDSGTRVLSMSLANAGGGTAYNAQITGVDSIHVTSGSGTVTLASGVPGPVPGATLGSGGSAATQLVFNWAPTATRVSITFRMTATDASGTVSYPFSQTVSTFR